MITSSLQINFRRLGNHTFGDFVVDGHSLADAIGIDRGLCTRLRRTDWVASELTRYVNRLLGNLEPDMAHGRVTLYVCTECGDIQCGAVGVQLTFTETTVTWSNFTFGSEDIEQRDPEDAELIEGLNSFTFDRVTYEAQLAAELT